MRKIQSIALMMAIALTGTAALTACSSSDIDENVVYDDNGKAGVKSEFVISIPRSVVGTTRMADEITQSDGSVDQFRGIDNIRLIAFGEKPTSASAKLADIMNLEPINVLKEPGTLNYKVYNDHFVPVGTTYFLFYGKAIDNQADQAISTSDDKFKFGILNATGLTDASFTNPNSITFSLQQIYDDAGTQSAKAIGQNILDLLTNLANTTKDGKKWSTSDNLVLSTLYKNFIGLTVGSSNALAIMLGRLYFSMDEHVLATDPARPLVNEIKKQIRDVCTQDPVKDQPVSLISDYTGYPGNLGLPEGAVRVRWNATGQYANTFTDASANYSRYFKQEITDYVYPAALWYYVNTPLRAAADKKSDQYDNEETWSKVISNVYNGASEEVKAGTKSIALRDPVQYGVGRVETAIKMGEGTFYDGNGKEVNATNGFTLKGVLIGGQGSVGYDFTMKLDENLAIYDREVTNNIIAKPKLTTSANQTLALETKKDQVVNAALELVNNGDDFMGFDGIIPHGGTFYLAVRLNPKAAKNYDEDNLNKIVHQDHVTKMTVTIKNGNTFVDRNGDGEPDVYLKDPDGVPTGVDDGTGHPDDNYDIDGDGLPDTFITDPQHGGPGWDIDGNGEVDVPVLPDPETGKYPDGPNVPDGLGSATNGIPDLSSPTIELGTSVNLEWQQGLILEPKI